MTFRLLIFASCIKRLGSGDEHDDHGRVFRISPCGVCRKLPAAKVLLDRFDYDAKDAQGYRLGPDEKPSTLTLTLPSNSRISRELATLAKRDLEAIGLRTDIRMTLFQDAINEVTAGRYQNYFGAQGGDPTGWIELRVLYGKSPPASNPSRFALPEYDRAAEQFMRAATEAERVTAARSMSEDLTRFRAGQSQIVVCGPTIISQGLE